MKYSIILPVHNGGDYIKLCVNSILSQTLPDFNLLILENCSDDGTAGWLHSLKDNRIQLFSSQKLLSIEENWARIISVPKNEYMTMIGHDDMLDKDYLKKMDDLIQQYPNAGLYQSHFRFINETGVVIKRCRQMKETLEPEEILNDFLNGKIDIMGTGFMMRSADYDRIGGIPSYHNLLFADMELWLSIVAQHFLAIEPTELFSYRRHSGATTASTEVQVIVNALDKFIDFINRLRSTDKKYEEIIRCNGNKLLLEYCQGLTHKLLRTPNDLRTGSTVAGVINQFRELGKKLNTAESFEPLDYFKIRLAKIIDGNKFLRNCFLLFKKIIKRPILK
jgi:glycosyltransferase involved in cell wall biosynthesis